MIQNRLLNGIIGMKITINKATVWEMSKIEFYKVIYIKWSKLIGWKVRALKPKGKVLQQSNLKVRNEYIRIVSKEKTHNITSKKRTCWW